MRGPDGAPFAFEILLGGPHENRAEVQAVVDIFQAALGRLGIDPTVTAVDPAQHEDRLTTYDYDMVYQRVGVSLSPGNEQHLYWGSEGVTEPGTGNLAGIDSPAVDAMIDAILASETREDFVAATRALDRVLTAGALRHPALAVGRLVPRLRLGARAPRGDPGLRRLDRLAARRVVARGGLRNRDGPRGLCGDTRTGSEPMQWIQVKDNWPAFIEKVEEEWPDADRETLEVLDGDRAALKAHLMEATGQDAQTIEEELRIWLESSMPLDVMMDDSRDNEQIMESGRYIAPGEDVYSDDRDFGDDNAPEPPIGRD